MKHLSLFLLLSCLAGSAAGQTTDPAPGAAPVKPVKTSRGYLRAATGYGGAFAGQTNLFNGQFVSGQGTGSGSGRGRSETYRFRRFSFGAGLNVSLAGGLHLGRHVAAELGAEFLAGPEKYRFTYDETGEYRFVTEMQARRALYVIPAVVVHTGGRPWDLYARLGVVLPLSNRVTAEKTYTSTNHPGTTVYNHEYRTWFTPGLKGAFGLSRRLTDRLDLHAEVTGIAMNAFVKTGEMTAYTINGTDHLQNLSISQRLTNYRFRHSSTGFQVGGQPRQEATFSIPFSTLGGSIGVTWGL